MSSHISTRRAQNYRSPSQLFKMRLILSLLKIIRPWLWINNSKMPKLNNRWSSQQAARVHRGSYFRKVQPRVMLYKKLIMADRATVSQSNKLRSCQSRWILDIGWESLKSSSGCSKRVRFQTNRCLWESLRAMSKRLRMLQLTRRPQLETPR